MPHNPRRYRGVETPVVTLTEHQIAEAMQHALALRRRTVVDPSWVGATSLDARDAVATTESWRVNTRAGRLRRGVRREPEAWYLIGWVYLETAPWSFITELGKDRYCGEWEVWLNRDDGRVWLKYQRRAGFADDPYP